MWMLRLEEHTRLETQQTLDTNASGISSSTPNKLFLNGQGEYIGDTQCYSHHSKVDGVLEDERPWGGANTAPIHSVYTQLV